MPLVLLNPHAQGGRLGRMAGVVRQALAGLDPTSQLEAPATLPQALEWLIRQPLGARVVAVGGDGTVNRWLPALRARRLQLGLVPLGSGNDLARALGVQGLDWRRALAHALSGVAQPMDVGLVRWWGPLRADGPQEAAFLSSLAAGFDASVGRRALEGPRWLRGQPRYLWATLRELAALRTWDVRLHLQPTSAEADMVSAWQGRVLLASALNTATYGSGMPAAPQARVDDGQLELLRAEGMGRAEVLALLPRLLRGTHLADRRVTLSPCCAAHLESASALPIAVDGEFLGEAGRLELGVEPGGLWVVRAPHVPGQGKT